MAAKYQRRSKGEWFSGSTVCDGEGVTAAGTPAMVAGTCYVTCCISVAQDTGTWGWRDQV